MSAQSVYLNVDGSKQKVSYFIKGCGQPILLLHCWGGDGYVFKNLAEKLSNNFNVICPDLHISDPNGKDQSSVVVLAKKVEALLEYLEVEKINILGWSLGGLVGLQIVRNNLFDLNKMVIYEASPKIITDDTWEHGIKEFSDEANKDFIYMCKNYWNSFSRLVLDTYFSEYNPNGEDLKKLFFHNFSQNSFQELAEVWQSAADSDYRQDCKSLKAKTLILFGAHSKIYSNHVSNWLLDNIKGSQKFIFLQSGHSPHLEEADCFYRTINDFLCN